MDNVFKVIQFTPVEKDRIYREIGRFIFEFSQLEYTLRHHVSEMARLDEQYFDIITSAFDFAKLCTALLALSGQRNGGKPDPEVEKLIKTCHEVNTVRLRVVHGLWVVGSGHDRAIHTSRNSMKSEVHFDKPGDLDEWSDKTSKLRWGIDQAVNNFYFERPK
jgi:hypothetical protein